MISGSKDCTSGGTSDVVVFVPQMGSDDKEEAPDLMDLMQMEALYCVAKKQGFLPPMMLEQVGGFTMKMNSFFIEAQQRIKAFDEE